MFDLLLQSGFLVFFFAPMVLSVLYLYYLKRQGLKGLSLRTLSLIVTSVAGLAATAGVFLFRGSSAGEFVLTLPVSSENFEVSVNLSSERFLWLLGNTVLFLNFLILFGEEAFSGKEPILRYLYLLGAFFMAAIVFLADQVFMSVIFVEISFFLMHAFHLLDGGLENDLERVSYFKRSAFIFLGLILMMLLYGLKIFSVNAIVLCGMVLYEMSLLFSRHNFLRWSKAIPSLFPVIMAFFIGSRILHPGLAGELWLPLSVIFAIFCIGFTVLSMLALASLNAFYWWSIALFCGMFSLQFSSGSPGSVGWSIMAVLALLCVAGIGSILEQVPRVSGAVHRYSAKLAILLLYAVAVGALPGICVALEGGARVNYSMVSHLLLIFVLAVALGKLSFVQEGGVKNEGGANPRFVWSLLFAFVLLVSHYVALFALTDTGILDIHWKDFGTETDVFIAGSLGLALLGVLIAFFLSANQKFLTYLKNRERHMENALPHIDPRLNKLNALVVSYPQVFTDEGLHRFTRSSEKLALWACIFEERFLQNSFWRESHAYLSSLSRYVRFFHRGSVRFYVFVAIVFFVGFGFFMIFV